MKKFRRRNIAVMAVLCAFFTAFNFFRGNLKIPCIFRSLTSVPCPGCGGMRSTALLMQGDLKQALLTNPLSVLVVSFVVITFFWLLCDTIRNRDTYWRIYSMRGNKWWLLVILLIIIANWIWNICKFGIG